jgi:PhzF family phenazine biosynthesis protein
MKVPLYLVDAFAKRPLTGNPAAICLLDAWPDAALMQAIAVEMNLSETAFIVPEGKDWRIRWFTPTLEVDLVGHATLAAAHVLFARGLPDPTVTFESLSGPLHVTRDGALLMMDFPARVPVSCATPPALSEALGCTPREVLAARHYLAIFEDEAEVRGLTPDMVRLAALDRAAVIVSAPGGAGDFVSRFFAPANGVPEDPVSGVAHCTLVPYWSKRLGKRRLDARQVSKRGGRLVCEDRDTRVAIGGSAVLVLEGTLTV